MKVLITGDRGFVGTETKNYLNYMGIEYIGYDIMDGKDIRSSEQLESEIRGCDRILHLAAIARFSEADNNPKLAFETNAIGTKIVANIATKYHIPLVYASTGSVYMPITKDPPITEDFEVRGNSVYGCSKALGEIYLKESLTPWMILRYAHLYGKEKRHHGLIGGFIKRIEFGLEPILYGGLQSNDFCYIKDIARANYLALTASFDAYNQEYNIGTGKELTAKDAGEQVCKVMGYKGKTQIKEGRTVDPLRFVYDCSKAERMLGFRAEFSFADGLKDMI